MKTKTKVKSGAIMGNHNRKAAQVAAKPVGGMKIKTSVKAGAAKKGA